jgi:hypothetical protein
VFKRIEINSPVVPAVSDQRFRTMRSLARRIHADGRDRNSVTTPVITRPIKTSSRIR